jgi:hypothetical protein
MQFVMTFRAPAGGPYRGAVSKKASKSVSGEQLFDYWNNESRGEATLIKWRGLRRLEDLDNHFKIFRFDWKSDR